MSFPPSASCKFLDLPPVNLRNLHLHLTKNPFASRPPHLCGVTIEILLFSFSRTFAYCPGGDGCITSSGSYPHYSGERAARLCKLSTLLCKSCRYIWEKIIRIRQCKSYLPRFRWKSVGEMPTVLRKVRRKEEYELNPLWNAASVSDTPEAISSFAPQMRRNWMYSYTDVFV